MNKAKSVTMNLYKYACRLVSIQRFCGLELDRKIDVGNHTLRCVILGMTIADQYNKENPEKKINVEEVMRKAVLHDLEESALGDINSNLKNLDPDFKVAYKRLATRVMKDIILVGSPEPELYLKMWSEDKSGEGFSGEVVVISDMLEAFCTICYELKRGNKILSKAFNKYTQEFETGAGAPLIKKYSLAKQIYEENKAMVNSNQTKVDEGFEAA